MKILYDLIPTQPTKKDQIHGGGKYAKIVFKKLATSIKNKENFQLFVLTDSTRKLDEEIAEILETENIIQCDLSAATLDKIVAKHAVQTFYSPLPEGISHWFPRMNCNVICTVHGLRMLEWDMGWNDLAYYQGMKKVKMAVKIPFQNKVRKKLINNYNELFSLSNYNIVTVSNHSKSVISSLFHHVHLKQIPVFYSPDVTGHRRVEKEPVKSRTEHKREKTFLMVSGSIAVKNNLRAAYALDELMTKNPGLPLKGIITGVTNPEMYHKRLKNRERFQLLGYVTEEDLSRLYTEAYAFVYPTLNEGFGYPPLEAMSAGTPVISSPFASIPEVCADAVLYANPYSVSEIKSRMLRLIFDTELYTALVSKGYERYAAVKEKQDNDLQALVDYILNFGSS